MATAWIYFDMHHSAGHPDYLRVFATKEAAEWWLADIDPNGAIFEYDVLGRSVRDSEAFSWRQDYGISAALMVRS